MKRREFITLLGGAAAALPLAARAQQPGRMPLIAVLTGVSDDQTARTRAMAFVTRLQDLGWTDGRNMRLEYRWGKGDAETIRRQASDLVALAPDVIVTTGGPATERIAADDTQRADRVCSGPRSGRLGVCGAFIAAGRQCYWLHAIRIQS
jgi:hypothetical protein